MTFVWRGVALSAVFMFFGFGTAHSMGAKKPEILDLPAELSLYDSGSKLKSESGCQSGAVVIPYAEGETQFLEVHHFTECNFGEDRSYEDEVLVYEIKFAEARFCGERVYFGQRVDQNGFTWKLSLWDYRDLLVHDACTDRPSQTSLYETLQDSDGLEVQQLRFHHNVIRRINQ